MSGDVLHGDTPIFPLPTDNGERELTIHGWHTECRHCGYGRGGWAGGPGNEGKPILTPDSRTCHGCGCTFTHSLNVYTGKKITLRKADAA